MSETRVFFGNLTISAFENRTKVKFSDTDKQRLEELRSEKADVGKGKLHIFDIPFTIHANEDIFKEVLNILYKYDFSSSEQFTLAEIYND